MLPLLLALSSAADLEVAAEFATVPTTHASQDRFGYNDAMPALGARVGVPLTDALTVQLAGHHGARGARWSADDGTPIGNAAFYATDLALGLEAVVPVNRYFAVGGLGSVSGMLGAARFDDDRSDPDSPVQLRAAGFAPGFRASGAIRITVPESALPVPLLFRISSGYQWSAPLALGDFGSTRLRGFSLRMSMGVRF